MASFMSSFFPGGKDRSAGDSNLPRPATPKSDNFINPPSTPQGSPSKKTNPPGANDLPAAFDHAMTLTPGLEPPLRLGRPQSVVTPLSLSPGKSSNAQPLDESSANVDDSVIHKARSGSPLKKQGQENTPPASRLAGTDSPHQHNHAALSRQQLYEHRDHRDRPTTPGTKRFNTARGLTAEEREILQKPNVKRMVNVTQLYFLDYYFDLLTYVGARQNRLAAFKSEYPPPPETDEETHSKMWTKYTGRERANLRKRRVRLRHGDFQILTQVGQGGYGQVFLAQKKDTREVCALKVMSKKLLFKLDEVRHVLTERDILTTAQSEWLVRLLYSFQDEKSIYLAMEYVPGGDFRTLLNNTGVLSNRHARFYIAEMFCAVDALHQLGYIHRDLKPENFLVDSTGHVKLTDFGLAAGVLAPSRIESMRIKLEKASETAVPFGKPMDQRTVAERRESYRTMRENDVNYAKSIVGSPDYMAPEVLRGEEYDFTVDYWSLGCMLFEALTGFPPFAGATPDETWRNLKHWKEVLKRPVWEDPNYFLSNRTWNFITTCINSRTRRFSNIKDICAHHYFAEVDWETLRQTRAPFVPELDSETDAGYFDDFTNEADMAKYKEVHEKQQALETMAEREDQMSKSLFVGFTFRHRKPAGEDGSSPRKRIPTDDTFGTML
ncbi:serine/threonine-protein kinase dbf2 [Fusarium falciforme]|uniref:non-specific serine/threonine protein kinase n=1 Tax=Fusarium falciforme TaxID=195108 RepID=A0A9W8RDV8_9HYPO|nr:serine/threonine-protein kinase dbf2 [Fusarium falciforme]KAJ4194364.1 serine/threonine-protein kinase dbf2 [Fusarium falciforme]KAJ4200910.1 serine/threonine-protein kinase dbf2 [Fusarium falciforme]KAJ4246209.1 serine/threonine-protein kinase dbf2 [Fusarium falciforme]